MIFSKELNKEYKTKKELFAALKENKNQILQQKKSEILHSYKKGVGVKLKNIDASKLKQTIKQIEIDDKFYYLAVNTTNILDSHDDLHVEGIWDKTVSEQQGKLYLVLDHSLKVKDTVVSKENIEVLLAKIPFSLIGKNYEGETQALIYKFEKSKIKKPEIKEWLESGDDIEASVRMQYVRLTLAMNSDREEDKEEKIEFDKFYPQIANKEDFDEIDYFFVIKEAKNVAESSLVLFGSNSATGVIEEKNSLEDIILNTKKQLKSNLSSNFDTEKAKSLLNELISEIDKKPPSTSQKPPESTFKGKSILVLRRSK